MVGRHSVRNCCVCASVCRLWANASIRKGTKHKKQQYQKATEECPLYMPNICFVKVFFWFVLWVLVDFKVIEWPEPAGRKKAGGHGGLGPTIVAINYSYDWLGETWVTSENLFPVNEDNCVIHFGFIEITPLNDSWRAKTERLSSWNTCESIMRLLKSQIP